MDLLAPAPARVLDRYVLERRLGSGGFGTVWQARDERLERAVAIKIVPRERVDEGHWREALATARLSHPAIVALYEAGTDAGAAYLVSELVRGETLAALLAERALSDRDVGLIGLALADGLLHAHRQGVIHRDVKPANVIVPESLRAGQAAAKLTDFGVAHVAGGEEATRTGDVVGTLAYMAPEQADGRRVTPAVDLYALALVLYEGLAGTNPVRGRTPAATARRVGARLPPLGRRRRELSRPLAAAIDRALDPRPERRGTVGELRDALGAALPNLEDALGGSAAPEETLAWDDPPPPRREPFLPDRGEAAAPRPPRVRARPVAPPARALAALGAGGLTALGAVAVASPPATPAALAILAGVACGLLPRLGWLLGGLTALGWLATAGGAPGAALLLAPALLAPLLLLPAAPGLLAAPALAPLLGLAGLASVFPLLAGQARSAYRRAALGALGAVVLALAEPLLGRRLLAGPPPSAPAPHAFAGSAARAFHDVLSPLLSDSLLLPALPWALAALALPWLVRGRSLGADAAGAVVWSLALSAGTIAAAPAAGAEAALGAALAGIGALALTAFRAPPSLPARAPGAS